MEPKCEEVCPEGYYGLQCVEPCNCNRKGNFVCHPVNGCVCKAGFAGSTCELRIVEGQVQEPPGKNILFKFLLSQKNVCGCKFVVRIFSQQFNAYHKKNLRPILNLNYSNSYKITSVQIKT